MGKCAYKRLINIFLYSEIIYKYSNLKKEQDACVKVVNPLTVEVIEQRKKEIQTDTKTGEGVKNGACFVDKLLLAKGEDGSMFTDKEIKDEVSSMIFAVSNRNVQYTNLLYFVNTCNFCRVMTQQLSVSVSL